MSHGCVNSPLAAVAQLFEWAGPTVLPGQNTAHAYADKTSTEGKKSASASSPSKWAYYKVKRKDTLGIIAKRHGVTIKDITASNKIKGSHIRIGQTLKIPQKGVQYAAIDKTTSSASSKTTIASLIVPEAQATETVADKPQAKTLYTIRRGDSLGKIATRYNVSVATLKQWNPSIKKNKIIAGQTIAIYSAKASATPSRAVANTDSPAFAKADTTTHRYYKVKSGDTLWEIAKAHAANVDDIKRLNATKLGRGNNLKVGLVLAIPATNT